MAGWLSGPHDGSFERDGAVSNNVSAKGHGPVEDTRMEPQDGHAAF